MNKMSVKRKTTKKTSERQEIDVNKLIALTKAFILALAFKVINTDEVGD